MVQRREVFSGVPMKRMTKAEAGDWLNGPVLPKIIVYTLPIILTGVLQLLFNAADLVVVGRFNGNLSVAAVGATGTITNLIINLFIGLSMGAGVSMSHAIGAGNEPAMHRVVHTAVPVALASGVLLTAVGVTFAPALLQLMKTPEEILPLSTLYMQIYFAGMTANMLYNTCAAILRAAGDTTRPLIFLMIAGVTNVALNLLFVIVFHMDVAGVALATILSQALSAVLVVRALRRRTDGCRLDFGRMRIYREEMIKILRLGIPAGLQGAMFSISNVLIQSSINSFGAEAVSGNAAAGNIEGFVYISYNSFSQAVVNFTGRSMGAHRFDRVKKIFWSCMACSVAVAIGLSLIVWVFGRPLLHIYITDSDAAIEQGMIRFLWVGLFYFLCAAQEIPTNAMRGLGMSLLPTLLNVFGICVLRIIWIVTVFQMPQYHNMDVLLMSYPVSWIITFALGMTAFTFGLRSTEKKARAEEAEQTAET